MRNPTSKIMKNLLFFLLIPIFANAQQQIISSKIEKVTVFFNGAQIERKGQTNIPAGKSEFVFKSISPQIDKQSIQLSADTRISVLAINHQLSTQSEGGKKDEIQTLNKQKEAVEDKIMVEKNSLLVFKREEEMLLKNQTVGGTYSGMKSVDLKEAVEYQRVRMQEVLNKQYEIGKTIKNFENEIRVLNQKLTEITTSKEVTFSEIVLSLSNKEPINNANFTLTYFVQNAGWSPVYDVRVNNISQPLNLLYKANVYQYSGEDWKDTRLVLSNANPRKSGVAPELEAWV
jgi:uncharacterized protein (TIGR02231 family)